MTLRNTLGALFVTGLIGIATACGSSADADADIHVGSSCKEFSASEGGYRCDGQSVLFCSSATDYTFKEMLVCKEGKTCSLAADKTSAACE